jgi:MFS family permease
MTLGYGFLGTLLAVRMQVEGFATFTSGLVMAEYFLGLVVGSQTAAKAVRAVGHIRVFAAFASLFSAATLVHVFFVNPFAWGGLRFIEGYCMAGLFLCVESWLNDRATNETRGSVLSMYMITTYLFGGLAQFLLILGAVEGFFLFAVTSVLASLALLPVALSRSPAPPLPAARVFGLRRLLEISPVGVGGCFVAGLTSGAFYALGPRFGAVTGLDSVGIAALMGFAIFGGLVFQLPLGRLSDRIDRRRVIVGASVLLAAAGAALSALVIGAEAASVWHLLLVLPFGGMLFALYPLSLAHANDHIDPQDFVAASGGLILSFSTGATIGPIAASGLMTGVGPSGLFGFIGGCAVALAGFVWYRVRTVGALATDDKTPFQLTPRTALAVTELDPRSEDGQLSFAFEFP